VFFDGENIVALHPSGTVRSGLPCIDEAAKLLKKAKVKSCVFAAEYYLADGVRESRALEQVLRVLRSPSTKKELERINLAVFDIAEVDGKPLASASKVFATLETWFGGNKSVRPVEHKEVSKTESILELYLDWVISEGAEGLVVRHDQTGYYKVKVRHNLDAAIGGYKEINLRALRLLGPGGVLVTCSCSHHLSEAALLELVAQAALDSGRTLRVLERRTQSQDHPILLTVPETHYLKCLILEVV